MRFRSKNQAILYYLKAKNIYENYKLFLNAGIIFWLGIFLIVFGIHWSKEPSQITYQSDEISTYEGLKKIENNINHNAPFTLVFYRPNCPACKSVEKKLMKSYWEAKNVSTTEHFVLNANRLTEVQKQKLIKIIPSLVVQQDHIPTPLVVNVIPINKHAMVQDISTDNSPARFNSVLENSKNLKGMEE